MDEVTKIRRRKCKLEPRMVEKEDEIVEMQASPQKKRPKLELDSPTSDQSSQQFDICIEVECCDDTLHKENESEDWAVDKIITQQGADDSKELKMNVDVDDSKSIDIIEVDLEGRSNNKSNNDSKESKILDNSKMLDRSSKNDRNIMDTASIKKEKPEQFDQNIEETNIDRKNRSNVKSNTDQKVQNIKTENDLDHNKDINKSVVSSEKAKVQNVVPKHRKCKMFIMPIDYILNVSKQVWLAADGRSKSDKVDKFVGSRLGNMWANYVHVKHVRTHYEDLIQKALYKWQFWYDGCEEVPLLYKCYKCLKCYWELSEFRNHLSKHTEPNINIDLEELKYECNIVAYIGQYETKQISIGTDCWKCGKDIDRHTSVWSEEMFYSCHGCKMPMKTCTDVALHEGTCKLLTKSFEMLRVQCHICRNVFGEFRFFKKMQLEKHITYYHTVRTDRVISCDAELCNGCGDYFIDFCSNCTNVTPTYQCTCEEFLSDNNRQSYRKYHDQCKYSCMTLFNVLNDTNNYIMVYKCGICEKNTFFINKNDVKYHIKQHLNGDWRENINKVIVPVKCLWPENLQLIKPKNGEPFYVPVIKKIGEGINKEKQPIVKTCNKIVENNIPKILAKKMECLAKYNKEVNNITSVGNTNNDNVGAKETSHKIKKAAGDKLIYIMGSGKAKNLNSEVEKTEELRKAINKGNTIDMGTGKAKKVTYIRTQRNVNERIGNVSIEKMANEVNVVKETSQQTAQNTEVLNKNVIILGNKTVKVMKVGQIDTNSQVLQDDRILKEDEIKKEKDDCKIKDTNESNNAQKVIDNVELLKESEIKKELNVVPVAHGTGLRQYRMNKSKSDTAQDTSTLTKEHGIQVKSKREIENNTKSKENGNVIENGGIERIMDINEIKVEKIDDDVPSNNNMNISQDVNILNTNIKQENIETQEMSNKEQNNDETTTLFPAVISNVTNRSKSIDITIKQEIESDDDDLFSIQKYSGNYNIDVKMETEDEITIDEMSLTSGTRTEDNEITIKREIEGECSTSTDKRIPKINKNIIKLKTFGKIDFNDIKSTEIHKEKYDKPHKTYKRSPESENFDFLLKSAKSKLKTYKCKGCDFEGIHSEFKEHIPDCDDPKKIPLDDDEVYICTKCDNSFGSIKKYLVHLQYHGVAKKTCPQCYHAFNQYSTLKHHVFLHVRHLFVNIKMIRKTLTETIKAFHCKRCYSIVNDEQLFDHWEKHLDFKDGGPKVDVVANSEPSVLKSLVDSLTGPESKDCVMCNKLINRPSHMRRHHINHLLKIALANRVKNEGLTCPICNVKLPTPMSFRKHLHTCASLFKETVDIRSYDDTEEDPKEGTSSAYVHDNRAALEPKTLEIALSLICDRSLNLSKTCMICKRLFRRRHDMKRHIVEHLLSDAYAHKYHYQCLLCQICDKKMYHPNIYRCHMREHASYPIYKCEDCDKTFSDASNFTKHKKTHNINVLVCDICKKKFQLKKWLIKHIEEHQNEAPKPCTECNNDKLYYSGTDYRRHLRTHCAKTKRKLSYRCPNCMLKFNSVKEKWEHMWNVHNERKNIADCPVCFEKFRRFVDVKRHVKRHHRLDVSFLNYDNSSGRTNNKQIDMLLREGDIEVKMCDKKETLVIDFD